MLELDMLINESAHVRELIKIHKKLNHNFLTKMWEKYNSTARGVYREYFLNKNKKSAMEGAL